VGEVCLPSCPGRRGGGGYGGIQERRQGVPCHGGVCCPAPPASPAPPSPAAPPAGAGSPSLPLTLDPAPSPGLPITECPATMKCVSELFCDASATMSFTRVELTAEEWRRRGSLIPCMDPATRTIAVCCTRPPVREASSQQAPLQQQALQQAPAQQLPVQQAPVQQAPIQQLPVQQQQHQSCPVLTTLPPLDQCTGRQSDCWSPGVRDLDCLNSSLCCFDGCANRCQGAGPAPGNGLVPSQDSFSSSVLSEVASPAPQPSIGSLLIQPLIKTPPKPLIPAKPKIQAKPQIEAKPLIQTKPAVPSKPAAKPSSERIVYPEPLERRPSPGLAYGVGPPQVETAQAASVPLPKEQEEGTASEQQQVKQQVLLEVQQQVQQQVQNQVQAQQKQQNEVDQIGSAALPFTQCPSAMKCVDRSLCDFNGVMREFETRLSPEQELLRVPLIPCVSGVRAGPGYTCCRDPNYKDPWPEALQGEEDGQWRGEQSRSMEHRQPAAQNIHQARQPLAHQARRPLEQATRGPAYPAPLVQETRENLAQGPTLATGQGPVVPQAQGRQELPSQHSGVQPRHHQQPGHQQQPRHHQQPFHQLLQQIDQQQIDHQQIDQQQQQPRQQQLGQQQHPSQQQQSSQQQQFSQQQQQLGQQQQPEAWKWPSQPQPEVKKPKRRTYG